MAKVSERPLEASMLGNIRGCARDGYKVLGLDPKTTTPEAVVEKIDEFVDQWQQGARPAASMVDADDMPFMMGSLWGEQVVLRLGWEWAMATLHDHGDSKAPGVLAPDRSLAIYPIHFIHYSVKDPRSDVTIALAYNMLLAGKITQASPGEYMNVMLNIHRIVPRR